MVNGLLERGYKQIDKDEFVREGFTIRFERNRIEVFDDPEIGDGYYFSGDINKVDIKTLLEEIEEIILN